MRQLLFAGLAALAALPAAAMSPPAPGGQLDLETIMANPDWIGAAVESPYWGVDGRSLYYSLKRDGSKVRDLYRVDPATGQSVKLDPAAMAQAEGPAVFDRSHRHAAYIFHGDVFMQDLTTGRRVQVTQTPESESSPRFSSDGRSLQFRMGINWFVYNLATGATAPAATLRFIEDPQAKKHNDLERDQLALFKSLRENQADKDAQRTRDDELGAADAGRSPKPIYLGESGEPADTELSPDGRWMVVVTKPKGSKGGKRPEVTHYVTESGYAEKQETRSYVGRDDPAPQSLVLVDLKAAKFYPLKTDGLPGIKDDPLKDIRAKTIAALQKDGKDDEAKALKAPDLRAVRIVSNADEAVAAALRGATTARTSPSSCAQSTTRIAGSPASTSTSTRWCRSTVSPTTRGSTGTSTISAGSRTAARCGTSAKRPAIRSSTPSRSPARRRRSPAASSK